MTAAGSRIIVREAYMTQYTDPISFRAGDRREVQRQDSEFPEWYWCRNDSGKQGWVHIDYLSARAGSAEGLKDYSARELNVTGDERGRVIESVGGWVMLEVDDGRIGWVPDSVVRES
jgi:hypothetical protein